MKKEIRNSLIYFAALMLVMIVAVVGAALKDAGGVKP
jgi:hypothetical protein